MIKLNKLRVMTLSYELRENQLVAHSHLLIANYLFARS